MNNQNQDDELEGFDTFEDEALDADAAPVPEDNIDDADFQDISDDVDADVFGEGEPAPVLKKKTNWFNIGVAVVAILGAGGLVLTKLGPTLFSGGDSTSPPPAAMASGTGTGDVQNAAQQAVAVAGNNGAQTTGLLDHPDQFANLGTAQPALPAPTAGGTTQAGPDPFANVPNQSVQPAPVAAPVATTQAPADTTVPMPAPISANTLPAMPAPEAAVTAAATDTVMPAPANNNSGIEGKVDALETRLNELDAKVSQAVDKLNTAAPADDTRLNAIQSSLERLESRLDSMGSSRPRTQAVSAPARANIDDDSTPAPVKRSTPKKAKAKAPAKRGSTSQWDDAYVPSAPAQATKVSTGGSSSGGWELRGAQPGRAIIAKGSDIREVGVGEIVPGLGEITGVAPLNGGWVVQGTTGRLSQ